MQQLRRPSREQIEQTKMDVERAERSYDLNKAAELKYGKLPELERKLEAEEASRRARHRTTELIKEEVDEEDIAGVVSRWTGIPVSQAARRRECRSCCTSETNCTSASSARMKR